MKLLVEMLHREVAVALPVKLPHPRELAGRRTPRRNFADPAIACVSAVDRAAVSAGSRSASQSALGRDRFGGIARMTFQMNVTSLPHAKLMKAIEAIGTRIAPVVRQEAQGVTRG